MAHNEPILIADGSRGIYAPQHAATVLREMLVNKELSFSGHTMHYGDLNTAASRALAEQGDAFQAECWDRASRALFYVDGVEYRIHQDAEGIFLVPDGYDLEQA